MLKNKVWEFNFEHRYRLEQRFIDFVIETTPNIERGTGYR
ncbi:hypothetical protein Q2T40_00555 [Winogradskyella maritima]|nr:hypothetical protein [Winogradskyella maritima]